LVRFHPLIKERPGWAGNHVGFYPFPTSIADEMREEHRQRVLGE
jgi:hypothetical protein